MTKLWLQQKPPLQTMYTRSSEACDFEMCHCARYSRARKYVLVVNSSAPELTAIVKVRAKVRDRDRIRVRVKVGVSVNNDNSGAGELTDKYPKGFHHKGLSRGFGLSWELICAVFIQHGRSAPRRRDFLLTRRGLGSGQYSLAGWVSIICDKATERMTPSHVRH